MIFTKQSRLYPYYHIALNTGLRPGELCALYWDHVDFKKKLVRVARTTAITKAKGLHIKNSPKNDASIRSVTIPTNLVTYLKKLKMTQKPNPLNLIVPGIRIDIMHNAVLNDLMSKDIAPTGLIHLTPHELRHTHATYLLAPKPFGLGKSIKAVSERLGHASTIVTMNTYAHVLEGMHDAIADALEEAQTIFV